MRVLAQVPAVGAWSVKPIVSDRQEGLGIIQAYCPPWVLLALPVRGGGFLTGYGVGDDGHRDGWREEK